MEQLKDQRILKFKLGTLEAVRKDVNLDQPARMKEAIDMLEAWVQKQPHFVKRDFDRDYLERTLITAKGLIERAKERLDKLCTFKTLMPEFYEVINVKAEFSALQSSIISAHMPNLTSKYHRVYIGKIVSDVKIDSSTFFTFYKYLTMLSEYFKLVEYCSGFVIILDCSDVNIMNIVTKINPTELKQVITLMTEGYGLRIKAIHVITGSKMADTLITLLKQVFSAKLAQRIHVHKSVDSLQDFVSKDILPLDYGGDEKSLKELQCDWLDLINSKEFLEYFIVMNKANTNESCRQSDKFNENYISLPGSFRSLSVD